MSDNVERGAPAKGTVKPLSHGQILRLMAIVGIAGAVIGWIFVSAFFAAGVFIGTLLAFINYYWLKRSLMNVFAAAAEMGDRPRWLGLRYIGRYVVLAAVVAIFYVTNTVSVVGLILGMGTFGFAVVFEGIIKIFVRPDSGSEN